MFKDIVESQDLYGKKDDFWKKNETINSFFLYFINISVKCIFCWIFVEIVKNQDLYSMKDDFSKK